MEHVEHMTEGTTTKESALFEDSTFNVITQIEKKADFLYSSVKKYIRDAEKDKKPELVKLWSTMKGDEQKHPKNAAQTASKGSKRKQTTVDKVQGYAVSRVSVYRQQVSIFLLCGIFSSYWTRGVLPLIGARFCSIWTTAFSLEPI
jgi:hypothetical protein